MRTVVERSGDCARSIEPSLCALVPQQTVLGENVSKATPYEDKSSCYGHNAQYVRHDISTLPIAYSTSSLALETPKPQSCSL
jgi:hypothetical protein